MAGPGEQIAEALISAFGDAITFLFESIITTVFTLIINPWIEAILSALAPPMAAA